MELHHGASRVQGAGGEGRGGTRREGERTKGAEIIGIVKSGREERRKRRGAAVTGKEGTKEE